MNECTYIPARFTGRPLGEVDGRVVRPGPPVVRPMKTQPQTDGVAVQSGSDSR